jgi:hypothetical protein
MATNSNPTNSSAVLKLTQHDHLMSKLIGRCVPRVCLLLFFGVSWRFVFFVWCLFGVSDCVVGSGSPDTRRHEWAENMARDTLAYAAAAPDLLLYLALAQGVSVERARSVRTPNKILFV